MDKVSEDNANHKEENETNPKEEIETAAESEGAGTVRGDVIGDTAYSERFVLRLLLKLANLNTLKNEITEKSFEEELCVLWDMTAERDVVLFLHNYDLLKILNCSFMVIESPRIIEIVIGIIGNMCCQNECAAALSRMDTFLQYLIEHIQSDDSRILTQVLRLVNSCLYLADRDDINEWMITFTAVNYSHFLYFILKNSSNKDLLYLALENLNTICTYCSIEKCCCSRFFRHFVRKEALTSLSAAFTEVAVKQTDHFQRADFERILVICLQIILHMAAFDPSPTIFSESEVREDALRIVVSNIAYHEDKFVKQKEIDSDLVDILISAGNVIKKLSLSAICGPDKFFIPTFSMFNEIEAISIFDHNNSSFDDEYKEQIAKFSGEMRGPLSTILSLYSVKCSDQHLLEVLDILGPNCGKAFTHIDDELKEAVLDRATTYVAKLKDMLKDAVD